MAACNSFCNLGLPQRASLPRNCRHRTQSISEFARGATQQNLRNVCMPQGKNAKICFTTECRTRNTEAHEAMGYYEDDFLSQPVNYGTRRVAPIFVVEQ
eukprot:3222605-Pyramimonas_sp.AAC.1